MELRSDTGGRCPAIIEACAGVECDVCSLVRQHYVERRARRRMHSDSFTGSHANSRPLELELDDTSIASRKSGDKVDLKRGAAG